MAGVLGHGAVLLWRNYKFDDGGVSDKLLWVLGAKKGCDIISVLCTSRPPPGQQVWKEGCFHALGYYFVPKSRHGQPKDTWIQLWRIHVLSYADALHASMTLKTLEVLANIPTQLANEIRNCLKLTSDVTPAQIQLLE